MVEPVSDHASLEHGFSDPEPAYPPRVDLATQEAARTFTVKWFVNENSCQLDALLHQHLLVDYAWVSTITIDPRVATIPSIKEAIEAKFCFDTMTTAGLKLDFLWLEAEHEDSNRVYYEAYLSSDYYFNLHWAQLLALVPKENVCFRFALQLAE